MDADTTIEQHSDSEFSEDFSPTKILPEKSNEIQAPNEDKINIPGIFIGILAECSYSFGPALIKVLILRNPEFSIFEILFWKSFTMIFLNYNYCRYHGVFPMDVPKHFRNLIVFRALIGYSGI